MFLRHGLSVGVCVCLRLIMFVKFIYGFYVCLSFCLSVDYDDDNNDKQPKKAKIQLAMFYGGANLL